MRKVLIVRFSSLGDILQCFPAAQHFKALGYDQVHWLTRSDFGEVVGLNPYVDQTLEFPRARGSFSGFLSLFKLAFSLRGNYDLVYDAHNNLRSHILCAVLRWNTKILRRKKFRWRRFLLFKFHWNLFKSKVIGQQTFLDPLNTELKPFSWKNILQKENYVALVPGAAWALKQWPLKHWLDFIQKFPEENFVILGGKSDNICFEIENEIPRVKNFAGQLSLAESIGVLSQAKAVVSNDTGLLHAADLFQVPTVALIGPSAFGYPAAPTSETLEVDLWCKPCSKDGRGRCKNKIYQKCMVDISPQRVAQTIKQRLKEVLP